MIGSVLASKLCSMLVLCGLSRQYSNVSMRTRNLLTKAGVLGSVSMAFGSMLWSHKKTEPTQTDSGSAPSCKEPHFPYELKLVQVLFRHGARTPLKSIPGIMEVRDHLCHTRTSDRPDALFPRTWSWGKAIYLTFICLVLEMRLCSPASGSLTFFLVLSVSGPVGA